LFTGNDESSIIGPVFKRETGFAGRKAWAPTDVHEGQSGEMCRNAIANKTPRTEAALKVIDVTAAIITNAQGEYLIARRKAGKELEYMWELPGGKIEPGETPEQCLRRELREEFTIETQIGDFFAGNCHPIGQKIINLIAYHVKYLSGEFKLLDHDEIRWIKRHEFQSYEFAPADIPIIKCLSITK